VYVDWRNGKLRDETVFTHTLMPAIDRQFRTIADGRHRAIAGFSGGGFGAMYLAARNPQLFAAVGGLSAITSMDENDPR
jgi:S-formylglutathione hydrolase FrmB